MAQVWQLTTTRTIDLGWEQMLVLEGRPGTRVKVLFGDVWLTEHGSTKDHFPSTGDEITLTKSGRAVIEPLGPAWITITETPRRGGWRGLVDSVRARARAIVARYPRALPQSA
jgi:hypothetical protein